jgi:hypothetical protein
MIHKRDIEEAARRLPHPERYRGHGDVMRVAMLGPVNHRLPCSSVPPQEGVLLAHRERRLLVGLRGY